MTEFRFVTVWTIKAPLASVWSVIIDYAAWPSWWKGVEQVDVISRGGPDTVGFTANSVWKSQLPYRLRFQTRVVRVDSLREIAITATGELQGTGVMTFSESGGDTTVRYEWNVGTTAWWMNLLAPIARPFFSWNHHVIMRWGGEGLARKAGGTLVSAQEV